LSIEIIRSPLPDPVRPDESMVAIPADRATLAKRRWRGVAADGREFGFDLDHALPAGAAVWRSEGICYAVVQKPEPVIAIPINGDAACVAAIAWQIGNLHFPAQITAESIRVPDDPAIVQMLERAGIAWTREHALFRPLSAAPHAHHHHYH
jgi:urease accessory protein